MKISFQLNNKKFEDILAVSVNGETKELTEVCRSVDWDVLDTYDVCVQVKHIQKGEREQIKNPILRWVLVILFFPLLLLIFSINFLADNDNGISIHKFFYAANPFKINKYFRITQSNAEPVELTFVQPEYDKQTKKYSHPDILIRNAVVADETKEINYDRKPMKDAFLLYHCPAYTVLFLVIIALNALMAVCMKNQLISEQIDLVAVVGIGICFAIVLALLVIFIYLFCITCKLYKQVDSNLIKK